MNHEIEKYVPHANRRILARVIDVILIFMVYCVLANVTKYEIITATPIYETTPVTPIPTFLTHNFLKLYVSSLLIFWLCNIVLIIKNGQTIGKKLTGIKVVAKENAIPAIPIVAAIFIRELFFYSGITQFIIMGFMIIGPVETSVNIVDLISCSHVILDEKTA